MLRGAVCIFLLDFVLPPSRFHTRYWVREAEGNERLDNQFEVHFVQMPLLCDSGASGALRDWARYFEAEDDNELEALSMIDPIFDKARLELERLSADPAVRQLALKREEAQAVYRFEMGESRSEGKAEDLLRILLRRGLDVPELARSRIGECQATWNN